MSFGQPARSVSARGQLAMTAVLLCLAIGGCTTLVGEDFAGYRALEATATPPGADSGASAAPAACTDGTANGEETDTDCGGEDCPACEPGQHCAWAGDCASDVCSNAVCQAPSCTDFQHNGLETDLDCGGGVCPTCAAKRHCAGDLDCQTGLCRDGVCTDPTCANGTVDPGESDADCGGLLCSPCEEGQHCKTADDCASAVCTSLACQAPACTDQVRNGDETDMDCGGPDCSPCGLDLACDTDRDCSSGSCFQAACAPNPCSNGARDGSETGVDCGGTACAPCQDGDGCEVATDCSSGVCSGGTCGQPLCGNGLRDQDESDIDCGGMLCTPCLADRACLTGADCLTGACLEGRCTRSVTVTASDGSSTYGMDATEVTQASYAAFLAAMSGTSGDQPSYCSWNASFEPATSEGDCTDGAYAPNDTPNLPVTCVDWCDASAYCAWVGMRLCGAVGGGATPYEAFDSAAHSQWQNACSALGSSAYPYGDELDPTACNTSEYGAHASLPVTQAAACHGNAAPFSQLRDLSGNVWEWEDACAKYKNANDDCRIRGGSFRTTAAHCGKDRSKRRDAAQPDLGFRCCS